MSVLTPPGGPNEGGGLFAVAIYGAPVDDPDAPARLGSVLGCTAYEARSRLVHEGPSVVSTFASEASAVELGHKLSAAGFRPLVRSVQRVQDPAAWWVVRAVSVDDDGGSRRPTMLTAQRRQGAPIEVPMEAIAFVIHGVSVVTEESVVVTTTKKFSARRMGRKRVKKEVVQRSQERELFMHLYVPGHPILIVGETTVDYGGWDGHRFDGRAASFQALGRVLNEHSSARHDRRLLKRVAQKQLLGPRLDEEAHIKLCSALIVGALARATSPQG